MDEIADVGGGRSGHSWMTSQSRGVAYGCSDNERGLTSRPTHRGL